MTKGQASGSCGGCKRRRAHAMDAPLRAFEQRGPKMTIHTTQSQPPTTCRELARAWMAEIQDGVPDASEGAEPKDDIGMTVVSMTFLRSAEIQWDFLLSCVEEAETEDQLSHIAAGPFEGLMGRHGADYIDRVEVRAAIDRKFARMVCDSWRHMMTDEVWARVQAIQAAGTD